MSTNQIITLKLSPADEEKLYHLFRENRCEAPPYAKWQLRPENCVITCYESGKTVFQGKDAEVYASAFTKQESSSLMPQAATKSAQATTSDRSAYAQRSSKRKM